jgi:hypothetical protein
MRFRQMYSRGLEENRRRQKQGYQRSAGQTSIQVGHESCYLRNVYANLHLFQGRRMIHSKYIRSFGRFAMVITGVDPSDWIPKQIFAPMREGIDYDECREKMIQRPQLLQSVEVK